MPASRGQFIHCKYHPLYNRVVGGVNSDVVGTEERRLELRTSRGVVLTNQELDSVTQRHVYRLARRLNLTESLVGRLVAGGLVGRELVVAGLVVRGLVVAKLLFAKGLVGRSFIERLVGRESVSF
jgi:hypothetical protein